MSTRPLQPSKYFNENQKRTLARIMELMIPGTPEDPGAEQVGSVEFVDIFFDGLPESDRKDLVLLVKILSRPFGFKFTSLSEKRQVAIINWLKRGNVPIKPIAVNMKLAYFAIQAMTMTAFYSNFHTPDYQGELPWEQVGFDVPSSMIPEGALERPELAHIKRWKERQAGEAAKS